MGREMKRSTRPVLVIAATALCIGASAGADEAAARQQIRATYTFSPHELTTQQIDDKSKVLDELWARAKANKASYIPALRSELTQRDAQGFFVYDGSMLLLSLSDTVPDRRLALGAIARCDLRDVQHTDYLRRVHGLAAQGENTTEAALHILTEPQFKVFIPQHALTLGQDYSLIYMLMPSDPTQWLTAARARLSAETEPTAQKSLLLLMWYAQTNEADAAIAAFATDGAKPATNRAFAQELLSRNATPGPLTSATAALQSEESLRAARRETMKRRSDEALIELDEKTLQLAAKRK
jgi:hypothetical protein